MKIESTSIKQKEKLPKGIKWMPTIGNNTKELLEYFQKVKNITETSCNRLKEEAIRILSKCGNPLYKKNSDTGLVFGYIHSGKTIS